MEKRIFDGKIETRQVDGKDTRVLVGNAAVFNRNSEKLGGWFIERILPGAFDEVINDDVRALFNHDPNLILGRNKAGTLRLSITNEGLAYEIDLPDTQTARDLAHSIERGDVSQSSFAFQVGRERWVTEGEDEIREVEKVNRLFDISPVTYPAYPDTDTSIAKRSYEQWQEQHTPKPDDDEQRKALDEQQAAELQQAIEDIAYKIKSEIIKSAK
jgi:HK97 family phage prohead protease